MGYYIVSCITLVILVFMWLIHKHSEKKCKHVWSEIGHEYSANGFNVKFKVYTFKCKTCGDIKVKKFDIN